jgi:hypothetical protein
MAPKGPCSFERAEFLGGDSRELRRGDDEVFSIDRAGRSECPHRGAPGGRGRRGQRYDHARAESGEQVSLYIEQ